MMTQESRPGGYRTAISTTPQPHISGSQTTETSIPPSAIDPWLDMFLRRVITDALLEGSASYWERRAQTFEWVGNSRCDDDAARCRLHAAILRDDDIMAPTYRDDIRRLHYDDPTYPRSLPVTAARDDLAALVDLEAAS